MPMPSGIPGRLGRTGQRASLPGQISAGFSRTATFHLAQRSTATRGRTRDFRRRTTDHTLATKDREVPGQELSEEKFRARTLRTHGTRHVLAVANAAFAANFDFQNVFAGGLVFDDGYIPMLQVLGLVWAQPVRARNRASCRKLARRRSAEVPTRS
jgi:hypothetical protein